MLIIALFACNNSLDADSVRSQLDAPTARLSAQTLPQVTADLYHGRATRLGETNAWNWANGSGPSTEAAATNGVVGASSGFLGAIGCVASTLNSIDTRGNCDTGKRCESRFKFRSCLLNDDNASGHIRFEIAEDNRKQREIDRLTFDFRGWETTVEGTRGSGMDGVIEVEGIVEGGREELIYTSDLLATELDFSASGSDRVLHEVDIRSGIRLIAEDIDGGEAYSAEVLGWIDEDGDGKEDGSIVVRMSADVLDGGDFIDATYEVVDAAGVWSCTWTFVAEGDTAYESAGTCTDPSGATVDFDGIGR